MRSEKQLSCENDKLRHQIADLEVLKLDNERIQETLRRSEEEKAAILDAMFEFVVLANRDLEILWTNKAVNIGLGLSPDQIKGKHCYELLLNISKPCKHCNALEALKTMQAIIIEDRSVLGKIWDVRYYPIKDENRIISVYRDVTKRKLAELALIEEQKQKDNLLADLRASEHKYKILFEDSRDAILIITKEGRIIDANQACLDLFGIKREDLNHVSILQHISGLNVINKFIRNVEKNRSIADYPLMMKKKDGTLIDCLFTFSVKYSQEGNVLGYQGIIRDITEKKRMEKEILEIGERERREIGQELHDGLGQLLTAIALKSKSIEQILQKRSLSEAEDIEKITNLANEAIRQTRSLIKGLIPASIEAGGLLKAIEDMAAIASHSFGIPCHLHSDSADPACDIVVANQIFRIAQEATINAAKHADAERVIITLNRSDQGIILSVNDNGIGFSLEKTQIAGRGLQIMAYRARMIDATLRIKRNSSGGGTTVTCIVPIRAKAA